MKLLCWLLGHAYKTDYSDGQPQWQKCVRCGKVKPFIERGGFGGGFDGWSLGG